MGTKFYLASDKIHVFPASYRDDKYYKAKATSEENLVNLRSISDNPLNYNYAYKSGENIVIYIKGYRFEVKKNDLIELLSPNVDRKIYAFIRTESDTILGNRLSLAEKEITVIDIYSEEPNQADLEENTAATDINLDVDDYFKGLCFYVDSKNANNEFQSITELIAAKIFDSDSYLELRFDPSRNLINKPLSIGVDNIRSNVDNTKSIEEVFSTETLILNDQLLYIDGENYTIQISNIPALESDPWFNSQSSVKINSESPILIKGYSPVTINRRSPIIISSPVNISKDIIINKKFIVSGSTSSGSLEFISDGASNRQVKLNGSFDVETTGKLLVKGECQIDSQSNIEVKTKTSNKDDRIFNDGKHFGTINNSALLLSDVGSSTRCSAGITGNNFNDSVNASVNMLYSNPEDDTDNNIYSLSLPQELSQSEKSSTDSYVWVKKFNSSNSICNNWISLDNKIIDIASSVVPNHIEEQVEDYKMQLSENLSNLNQTYDEMYYSYCQKIENDANAKYNSLETSVSNVINTELDEFNNSVSRIVADEVHKKICYDITKDDLKLNIFNLIYPVGSIYMSLNDTSPALLFGGAWNRIYGRFLIATSDPTETTDIFRSGSTGGEYKHKLSVEELPTHNHRVYIDYTETGVMVGGNIHSPSGKEMGVAPISGVTYGARSYTVGTRDVGSSAAHNNLPPYYAVNMWHRTK